MIYHLLADIVVFIHFGFIIFALLGAILVVRWPKLVWLHLPCSFWATIIALFGGVCPLTPLENWLRTQAGASAYTETFLQHYLGALIYPSGLTPQIRILLGVLVLLMNLGLYTWVVIRHRRRSHTIGGN